MWAPFMDRISLPNHPSCDDELDEAIQKLSSAISRCSFAGVSDDEIYGKIVRAIPITHEHISKEEERKRREEEEAEAKKKCRCRNKRPKEEEYEEEEYEEEEYKEEEPEPEEVEVTQE